jgi:uncharacterized protein (DUF1800 family)
MTRYLPVALLCALIAACGGGETPGANPASATAATPAAATSFEATDIAADNAADGRKRILATAVNADGPATTLTVRAHAVLAGNVGAMMQVLVDGQLIQTVEVRATEPTDYSIAVPAMQAGRRVDVVFTNDGTVNGINRDLFVSYVIAGNTYVLPTAAGVTYDRGIGTAAFDGVDVIVGRTAMGWSGALRMQWPAPNMTAQLTVRASGSLAGNVGPVLQLRVDGITVGNAEVRNVDAADFTFAVPPLTANSRVDVVYGNDAIVNGADRNLRVHYLMAGDAVLLPTAPGVTYDMGSGLAAFDGVNVMPGQATLGSNGALRAKWMTPNMTDRITVRASGTLAGNVGPMMQVRVDDIVVGTVEVRAATATDYSFATLPMQLGARVDVVFTNDANINGADRNLAVAYVIAGKTFVLSTAPEALYDLGSGAAAFDGANVLVGRVVLGSNGALRMEWPAPNLTSSLTVRARGVLAGNGGPAMHLMVNGVVVGYTEVRSTEPADHFFAVPPLQPGDKLDLVYTNDATVDGIDRNLFVDYLVSGNTYVKSTAAGVTYDRGAGAAAFDGVDVLAGQTAMAWNGALRMAWPTPNVTDLVTVRASGTLAGNIGPILQLRVDGVAVSAVEVRSSTLADYQLAVPTLRPGNKVDVVFTNDALVNGMDRNLNVAYLMAGNTFLLPTAAGVIYDLGTGAAAFDGQDVMPGQSSMGSNGALRASWPVANVTRSITIRASATLAANVGAFMEVRVNGVVVGVTEVRSTTPADYTVAVPQLLAGSRIDIAFVNDFNANGQDRNLFVHYVDTGSGILVPTAPGVVLDGGVGEAAFDGSITAPGTPALYSPSSLRFTMPTAAPADPTLAAQYAASRFLQQATFGPTQSDITRLTTVPFSTWVTEQMAMPAKADFVNYVQGKYDLGTDYRPLGSKYSTTWPAQRFWATAATSPDQLRKRVAFALHHIFMVSQTDSNLFSHTRAYANYLDKLNQHAFGNFRTLLEEVALSPAMGIYLSHMRNRPEDVGTGRMPDENFAREVMQLFTIGLHELNSDGTAKLGSNGQPIETYDNDDVMALAKAFTGFSWAFPDAQLTEQNFRYGNPDYSVANDQRIDLLKMKAYPGQHSTAEKRLFTDTPNAVVIPAHSTAQDSVRIALDALFKHPNVGPFIGRQLIQHLVTSHPSPAYVARVAAKFNNNGSGVRGDLAAVVRAVLLDSEARTAPAADPGKLREPVLRVSHWMRSFGATSVSGEYLMAGELAVVSQRAFYAPSVFGYFRPGYVPPNTAFAASGTTMPELQIVNESTSAGWVNTALTMAGSGLGWTGSAKDVSSTLEPLASLSAAGNVDGLIERLNLLLLAGRMSTALKLDLLDAMTSVTGTTTDSHRNRARVALFITLSSPEFLVQR